MKKKILHLIALTAFTATAFTSCTNSTATGNANSTGFISSAAVGSGSDTYLETTMNTIGSKISMHMIIKDYFKSSGKARMERYNLANNKASLMTTSLVDAANRTQSILIDDNTKTYSINHIDTSRNNMIDAHTKYTVAKIGNETLMGFHCVHARIVSTTNYGTAASFMNGTKTTDAWLSQEVPVPNVFKKYMEIAMQKSMASLYNAAIANQLKQMGCVGFIIKLQIQSKKISSMTQLTKVSKDNFQASMFRIPEGYKQTEGM